jgi:single-strand DNA-binding protein
MNVVVLKGNLTRDPESRSIRGADGEVTVCNFALAVNRRYKKKSGDAANDTVFVDCEIWDKGADLLTTYFKKGDPILVNGSLKLDTWEKDGQKFSKLKVRVNEVDFINGKKSEGQPTTMAGSDTAPEKELVGALVGMADDPGTGADIPF